MKYAFWIFLLILTPLFGMRLTSEDFFDEGLINNPLVQPEFHVIDLPEGTKSMALVAEDPDADNFLHLVLYNIPANEKEIASGGLFSYGMNGWGDFSWGKLSPPKGERHRYLFTLYATDLPPILPSQLSRSDLMQVIESHVLATATMSGYYSQSVLDRVDNIY